MKVTLLDARFAKPGYTFVHYGSAEECRGCRLLKACAGNLERGRRYVVRHVRAARHQCRVFGTVAVAEVEEAEVPAALPKSRALRGAVISYSPLVCGEVLCASYPLCSPEGLKEGDRVLLAEVDGTVECRRGLELVRAVLRRV